MILYSISYSLPFPSLHKAEEACLMRFSLLAAVVSFSLLKHMYLCFISFVHFTHFLIWFSLLVLFLATTVLQNIHLTLGVLKSPPTTSLNKGKMAVFFLPGIFKFKHTKYRPTVTISSRYSKASNNQVSNQSKIPRVAKLISVNMPNAKNYLNFSLKIFMV